MNCFDALRAHRYDFIMSCSACKAAREAGRLLLLQRLFAAAREIGP